MFSLRILFLKFLKLGAIAYGGPAMMGQIKKTVVNECNWVKEEEFLQGMALGQVTPGPIMITATFIGYKLCGLLGAFMATIGIFYPSFFILVLLIPYYDRLKGLQKVRTMEQGILGSFIGMLGLVLYNFAKASLVDIPSILMAGGAYIALHKKIPLPYILISGGIFSILLFGLLG